MTNQSNETGTFHTFLSLRWYDEVIQFIFRFVSKTSELLLAAGIVVSTANFLTDGTVMRHNTVLSDAWAWAQAIAIDASLGIVFINAIRALQARDRVKALIFLVLTVLLATVAGLITHFDSYAHAAGLPVTDQRVSGGIPLWIMTGLRAIAVIGFLLTSRLQDVSFTRRDGQGQSSPVPTNTRQSGGATTSTAFPLIDYQALAAAILDTAQQRGTPMDTPVKKVMVSLESPPDTVIPEPQNASKKQTQKQKNHQTRPSPSDEGTGNGTTQTSDTDDQQGSSLSLETDLRGEPSQNRPMESEQSSFEEQEDNAKESRARPHLTILPQRGKEAKTVPDMRMAQAYQDLLLERHSSGNEKPISARELAQRAGVRRSSCSAWLHMQQQVEDVEKHNG